MSNHRNLTSWSEPTIEELKHPKIPQGMKQTFYLSTVGFGAGTTAILLGYNTTLTLLTIGASTLFASLFITPSAKTKRAQQEKLIIVEDENTPPYVILTAEKIISNYLQQEVTEPLYKLGYAKEAKRVEKLSMSLEGKLSTPIISDIGQRKISVQLDLKMMRIDHRRNLKKGAIEIVNKAYRAIKAIESTVEHAPENMPAQKRSEEAQRILEG